MTICYFEFADDDNYYDDDCHDNDCHDDCHDDDGLTIVKSLR